MTAVFKYRGGDWALVKRDLRSLARNQIYAAPFPSLNDPFESTVVIDDRAIELGRLVLNWRTDDQMRMAEGQLKRAVDQFVTFAKGMGVYSLSKSATDELLWAHYANSHQGFCIEFDLEKLVDYKLEGEEVLTVEYSARPPTIAVWDLVSSDLDKKTVVRNLTATKSLRWQYEEEIRICVGQAGLREYDFRAAKALYFGVRCGQRAVRLAMRLLRGRGIRYYQMQMVEKSYAMEIVELDDLYPNAKRYRERVAPVDSGTPYIDDTTRPFERDVRMAIEIARREPYCEKVTDAYLSSSKGTPENPVFYVGYERSDGLPRNLYYSREDIRGHALFEGAAAN